MGPWKIDDVSAEAFGERSGRSVSELPFGCCPAGHHDLNRTSPQCFDFGMVEGSWAKQVCEEVTCGGAHPGHHLWIRLTARFVTFCAWSAHAGVRQELLHRRLRPLVAVRIVNVIDLCPYLRTVGQQLDYRRFVRDEHPHLVWVGRGQREPHHGSAAAAEDVRRFASECRQQAVYVIGLELRR